jgi:hypothetical protein
MTTCPRSGQCQKGRRRRRCCERPCRNAHSRTPYPSANPTIRVIAISSMRELADCGLRLQREPHPSAPQGRVSGTSSPSCFRFFCRCEGSVGKTRRSARGSCGGLLSWSTEQVANYFDLDHWPVPRHSFRSRNCQACWKHARLVGLMPSPRRAPQRTTSRSSAPIRKIKPASQTIRMPAYRA